MDSRLRGNDKTMRNQIVILAGGEGTRMGGNIPKVLVMLKNKPLILHLLHELDKVSQLAKPVVVVGYKYQEVRAVLGDEFIYAYQNKQLGTAHALLSAKPKVIAENISVVYGDMPFIKAESLKKLISEHLKNQSKFSMLTSVVSNFENEFSSLKSYGKIVRDQKKQIIKIVEAKDANENEKKLTEVNPGIYMFETEWLWENLQQIENNNLSREYYLTDIVAVAVKQNLEILNLPIDPKEIIGINSPEDLAIVEGL